MSRFEGRCGDRLLISMTNHLNDVDVILLSALD
jgi:hypothetical protein